MRRDNEAKKELAYLLFMSGELQKSIASRVKVSEKTISKWVKDGGWDDKRAARTITRTELINKTLETIHTKLESGEVKADELVKLASAIEKLDKKNSPIMIIDIFMEFARYLKQLSMHDAECSIDFIKKVTRYQDAYVDDKINLS